MKTSPLKSFSDVGPDLGQAGATSQHITTSNRLDQGRALRRSAYAHRLLAGVLVFLLCATTLLPAAEEKKKAQVKANNSVPQPISALPPNPVLNYAYPAGAGRGTSVELILAGNNLLGPGGETPRFHASHPGITATFVAKIDPPVSAKNKPAAKGKKKAGADTPLDQIRIRLTVAPDTPLGEHDLRLVLPSGVSNRQRIQISTLPEISELEPNDSAQPLPAFPFVLNGQIKDRDSDLFHFSARRGQPLVFQTAARSLLPFIADAVPGWFDVRLIIYDAQHNVPLATVDDTRLRPDPVLVFDPPADGDYLLEVTDTLHRGRDDFVYRITAGPIPYIADHFPLGGPRGATTQVTLTGVNLPLTQLALKIPANAPALTQIQSAQLPGFDARPFATSDWPEQFENEPNSSTATAQVLSLPVVINGRIDAPGDTDHFRFHANKGDALTFAVLARQLDSPLDSTLTLSDVSGKILAANDDAPSPDQPLCTHQADSRLAHTFAATGDYLLSLRDAQGKGSAAHAYRLQIAKTVPDFSLQFTPDNPRVSAGDNLVLTVTANLIGGFKQPIQIRAANLPPGARLDGALIGPGETTTRLTLHIPPEASAAHVPLQLFAVATLNGRLVEKRITPAETVMQAFITNHDLPTRDSLLTILPRAQLTLAADESSPVLGLPAGSSHTFTLTAQRADELTGPVNLNATALPKGAFAKGTPIAAETNSGELTLNLTGNLKPGTRFNLIITGTLRSGRAAVTATAAAIPIEILPRSNNPTQKISPKNL